jgi:hypothetical protein
VYARIQEYVNSVNKVAEFNNQQNGLWSIEFESGMDSHRLVPPKFLWKAAVKLLRLYASMIERDNSSDTYIVTDRVHWPLRGILDDKCPDLKPSVLKAALASFYWVDQEVTLASITFFDDDDSELQQLFEVTLEVSVRLRAMCAVSDGWARYAHYHLHAPFQIMRSKLQGWRAFSEEVGESAHKQWKWLSQHTTRGGAAGRGWARLYVAAAVMMTSKTLEDCDADSPGNASESGPAAATILCNKGQRIIAGDVYALYQMMRRYMTLFVLQNEQALDWQRLLHKDHSLEAIEFHYDEQAVDQPEAPQSAQSISAIITPWDVIDRLGKTDSSIGDSSKRERESGDSEPSPDADQMARCSRDSRW